MLVELAAANAAYAVIKECISNGREIFEAGQHVVDFFNSTHSLEQKVKAAPEHRRSDLEEFFALEELKQRQKELRDLMLIAGRPGLLEDWDKFRVQARQQREAEVLEKLKAELAKKARLKKLVEQVLLGFWLGVLIIVLIGLAAGAVWVSVTKNLL